jgi:hypothetical protein
LITGRFTYGLGQQPLDSFGMPVSPGFFSTPLSQSSVVQTAPAQWGWGEWALVLGLGYLAFSILFTTKTGAGHVRGWYGRRKKRLAEYHKREAEHYES